MSFYIKDSTITFEWAIQPTGTPLLKADYDITLILPDGSATYTDDGITTYVAPTSTTQGTITYNLTPTVVGRYQITLSDGTASSHVIQAKREIFVVDPPAYVTTGVAGKLTQGFKTPIPRISWEFVSSPLSSYNYISTGVIGVTNYWVVCGNDGKLAYSTNEGANWTTVVTGTVEHLNTIAYDSDNERFLIGGNAGVLVKSSDGTNWTLDTTTTGISIGASGNIGKIAYSVNLGGFIKQLENWVISGGSPSQDFRSSTDFGVSWTQRLTLSTPNTENVGEFMPTIGNGTTGYSAANSDDTGYLSSIGDISATAFINQTTNPFTPITALFQHGEASTDIAVLGHLNGYVSMWTGVTNLSVDSTTFSSEINAAAYSLADEMYVVVGKNSTLGYISKANRGTNGSWTLLEYPIFSANSDINHVHYDAVSDKFIACTFEGELAFSPDGIT